MSLASEADLDPGLAPDASRARRQAPAPWLMRSRVDLVLAAGSS
jgi:hypothetical protein